MFPSEEKYAIRIFAPVSVSDMAGDSEGIGVSDVVGDSEVAGVSEVVGGSEVVSTSFVQAENANAINTAKITERNNLLFFMFLCLLIFKYGVKSVWA
jgi:hypothetical protein